MGGGVILQYYWTIKLKLTVHTHTVKAPFTHQPLCSTVLLKFLLKHFHSNIKLHTGGGATVQTGGGATVQTGGGATIVTGVSARP